MNASLILAESNLDPEDLHRLTTELCRSIGEETDINASLAQPGTKGDPVTIGAIALGLISSGAIANLISVLSSFAGRQSSVSFTLTRPDGQTLQVGGQNLRSGQYQETIRIAEGFLGGAPVTDAPAPKAT